MLFSGNASDKTTKYNVTIGKRSLEQVDQIKYLGIILNNKLSESRIYNIYVTNSQVALGHCRDLERMLIFLR